MKVEQCGAVEGNDPSATLRINFTMINKVSNVGIKINNNRFSQISANHKNSEDEYR